MASSNGSQVAGIEQVMKLALSRNMWQNCYLSAYLVRPARARNMSVAEASRHVAMNSVC